MGLGGNLFRWLWEPSPAGLGIEFRSGQVVLAPAFGDQLEHPDHWLFRVCEPSFMHECISGLTAYMEQINERPIAIIVE